MTQPGDTVATTAKDNKSDQPTVAQSASAEDTQRGKLMVAGATLLLLVVILAGIVSTGGGDEAQAGDGPSGTGSVSAPTAEATGQTVPDFETSEQTQPPMRDFAESYRVEDFAPGTFFDGAVDRYGDSAGGGIETPEYLSLSYPIRWADGTRVMVEVPWVLAEGNVRVTERQNGQLLLQSAEGFVVGVSVSACSPETLATGQLNSPGLLVQRLSETAVRACRPAQRLEMQFERPDGVLAEHIAVLDIGLLELGREIGSDYLAVDDRDAPGVPGRFRTTGPLQVGARSDAVTNVYAEGYGSGRVWAEDQFGDERWEFVMGQETEESVGSSFLFGEWSPPGVDGEPRVFVAAQSGVLIALSAETGQPLWTVPLNSLESPGTLVVDDEAGVGFLTTTFLSPESARPPSMRSIDLGTGVVLWETPGLAEGQWQWDEPQRLNGLLLVQEVSPTRGNAFLWALDEDTGQIIWRRDLGSAGTLRGSSLILARYNGSAESTESDDLLVVMTLGISGEVLRVDPDDGAILWRSPAGGSILQNGPSGTVFVGSVVDSVTGRLIDPTALSVMDGSLARLTDDGNVVTVELQTAQRRAECVDTWAGHVDAGRVSLVRPPSDFLVASSGDSWRFGGPAQTNGCVVTSLHDRAGSGSCEQWSFNGDLLRAVSYVECLDAARLGDAVLFGAADNYIADASSPTAEESRTASQWNGWWGWQKAIVVGDVQVDACPTSIGELCATSARYPIEQNAHWRRELSSENNPVSLLGVSSGVVVAGAQESFLAGIDIDDGTVLWESDVAVSGIQNAIFDRGHDRLVIFASNGLVRSLDIATGADIWLSEDGSRVGWVAGSQTFLGDIVVAHARVSPTQPGSFLTAVSVDTGEVMWSVEGLPGALGLTPGRLVAEPGRDLLLVSGNRNDPRFARLEPRTGETIWSTEAGFELLGIDAEGIVVTDSEEVVSRLSIATGEPL